MSAGKRILIIDDEADHAELVALLLRRKGYEVYIAADGNAGIRCALETRPDLVLLDFFMPAIDGITTAEHLRGLEQTQEVPIVMMSACAEDALRARPPISGRFSCLAKPFRAAELLWVVQDALEDRAAQSAVGP